MDDREDPTQPLPWPCGQAPALAGRTFDCCIAQCPAIQRQVPGGLADQVRPSTQVDPDQAWCGLSTCRLAEVLPSVPLMRDLGETLVWLAAHLDALWEIAREGGQPAEEEELAEADYWEAIEDDLVLLRGHLPRLVRALARMGA